MGISLWQLLLVLVIVFILFGAGKLPRVMGDVGKGVRNLRKGLKEEENAADKYADQVVETVDPPPHGHLTGPMKGDIVDAEIKKEEEKNT